MAPSRRLACLLLALLASAVGVAANVEKAIFVAAGGGGGGRGDAAGLARLATLTPERNAWRTGLPAAFPWAGNYPANGTTWVLLDALRAGQRYELRVCWAATQPTAFAIDVFDPAAVASTPALAASLAAFVAAARRPDEAPVAPSAAARLARIVAAADFVAADRAAMQPDRVPAVLADLILDPYLLNVLPRSLLPTVGAVLAVAVASAWLARRVVLPQLRAVAAAAAASTAGHGAAAAQKRNKRSC